MKNGIKYSLLLSVIALFCQCSNADTKKTLGKPISANTSSMENSVMHIVSYTSLKINKETNSKFEKHLTDLAKVIKTQKGCITSQWFPNPDDKTNYVFYIEFDNEKNFVDYRTNKKIVEIIKTTTAPLLTEAPTFRYFRSTLFKESK